MVAHFDAEIPPGKLDTLPRALNSILGSDITVYSIRRVNDDAHARFDAVARTYRYFYSQRRSPYSRDWCGRLPPPSISTP